jgi:Cyclic nucleotide-binding domain
MIKKREKPGKDGKIDSFNAQAFLDNAGIARKVTEYRRNESIYSQGDAAETVMYVQKGGVKLSVVNGSGKEAVVAMFGPTDFFGEGCMAGQTLRMGTTTAVTPTTLLVIQKGELLRGACVIRPFHRVYARAQHPDRGGFDRSTLQLQRKAAGADAAASGALWETGTTRPHPAESFPGNPGEHGRNHALAGELFHEQIPQAGLYRIQRQNQGQQVIAHCCLARIARIPG